MGHSLSSQRIQPRSPTDTHFLRPVYRRRRKPRHLPPELLLLILEEAFCTSDTTFLARCTGLRTAALVCKAWRHPAQQLLWRSVVVETLPQLNAFRHKCEADASGVAIAANVRILEVWNPAGDVRDSPPTIRDIAKLLQNLPRLSELHINRPSTILPSLTVCDLEFASIRRPEAPQLTVLRICYARAGLVHALLRGIPTLRFVEVGGCRTDIDGLDVAETTDSHAIPRPRCKLYELRWGFNSNLHAPHALSASSDSLRILALHSLPPAAALSALLPPQLRSLRVFRYHEGLPPAVSRCGALEEFVMQDHVPPAELLAALPDSLEHLALDCDDGNQRGLAAVAAWLRRGAHIRLRVLTCFSPDVDDPDWPDFVRACRSVSVELRCFKGWHGFYGNESEPLGEVARFPRALPQHAQRILVVDP